jgi:hypothetical protein
MGWSKKEKVKKKNGLGQKKKRKEKKKKKDKSNGLLTNGSFDQVKAQPNGPIQFGLPKNPKPN